MFRKFEVVQNNQTGCNRTELPDNSGFGREFNLYLLVVAKQELLDVDCNDRNYNKEYKHPSNLF